MKNLTKQCLGRLRMAVYRSDSEQKLVFSKFTIEFVSLIELLYEKNIIRSYYYVSNIKRSLDIIPDSTKDMIIVFNTVMLRSFLEKVYLLTNFVSNKNITFNAFDFAHIPHQYEVILVSTNRGITCLTDCIRYKIGGRLIVVF